MNRALVVRQIARPTKRFPAHVATVRLNSAVNPGVLVKPVGERETASTVLTDVRFRRKMQLFVSCQLVVGLERPMAVLTDERSVGAVVN
jgi:hypothetical protein